MKTSKIVSTGAAMTLAIFLGLSGFAAAQPGYGYGPMGMTSEQVTTMQQIRRDHWEKMQPIMQQHYAKMAELNNLAAAGVKPDDARVKAARKDLSDIDAKLYSARADMLKQMADKGLPYMGRGMGGRGMGRGGHGPGMRGYGHGPGMMGPGYGAGYGAGMADFDGCPGMAGFNGYNGNAVQSTSNGNK